MKAILFPLALLVSCFSICESVKASATIDKPLARLQSIDKITARTVTFDIKTGSTIKFGNIYIKLQACRAATDIEEPESAAFMQIWDIENEGSKDQQANWLFSGWMFASSPGLSAMDHPIYDVWVLECLDPDAKEIESDADGEILEGEGVVENAPTPNEPAPLLE